MSRRSRATGGPRGRPVKTDDDRLDSLVSFRVNEATFLRIAELANEKGMSPSSFARDVVLGKLLDSPVGTVNLLDRRIKVRR